MQDLIVKLEPYIRLSAFLGVFVLVALWELVAPRRRLRISRSVRWMSNIGIVMLDTAMVRLVFPVAAVGVAAVAGSLGWGLFNALAWPFWVEVVLAVVDQLWLVPMAEEMVLRQEQVPVVEHIPHPEEIQLVHLDYLPVVAAEAVPILLESKVAEVVE